VTTTIPASLAKPFDGLGKKVAAVSPGVGSTGSTTTTTQPTTSTTTPPPADASLDGGTITVAGDSPQWDVTGQLTLSTKTKSATGPLSGRIYVYEDRSAASNDLTLQLNGQNVVVKFRGNVASQSSDAAGTTYLVYGTYSLVGGEQFGIATNGSITVGFHPNGAQSTLSVALRSGS
jgi:hypothetical protein